MSFKLLVFAFVSLWLGTSSLFAADFDDAVQAFHRGDFDECKSICRVEVDRKTWNSQWTRLLIESHLETGDYPAALAEYEKALERFGDDLRIRLLGTLVYRMNNRPVDANSELSKMTETIQRMPWRYSGRSDLVPLGKLLVMQNEDPRQVLELCYDKALQYNPSDTEAIAASAELALEKADYAVASELTAKGMAADPSNPYFAFLDAKAWEETDADHSTVSLEKALNLNPNHAPSLLMLAENQIDGEQYDSAEDTIAQALKVNPHEPKAWALRAVIAHLRGQYAEEGKHRKAALEPWKLNPEVDFLIGDKLSRHYRFEEAVTAQRRALQMDPAYEPAMFALAQDLLRLGQTEEGWEVLAAVRQNDQYNVVAFNLAQLKEALAKFTSIEIPGFVIRMDAREARIYGQDVADLLTQARDTLVTKYDAQLVEPVYVEIFPRQQDFAIRTFGLPGGEGFLGVCFGRLITANSPASGGENPQNWQATLWHEYCHVVTLQKSKNRMPRWLSEGISVYEERQRNSTWGQPLDRQYREMLLSEDFTPISQLSNAFLRPKSGTHLQFAYFESSLAVEFIIEQFGFEAVTRLLSDLGEGLPINDSLERLTGSLSALDTQFEGYAKQKANEYSPDADWAKISDFVPSDGDEISEAPRALSPEVLEAILIDRPNNAIAIRMMAQLQLQRKAYAQALTMLNRLKQLEPNDARNDGVYGMLAACYRALEESDNEYEALKELVARSPNPLAALTRLIDVDRERKEWEAVHQWSELYLATQPLHAMPHHAIVDASDALENPQIAIDSLNALLELDAFDPARLYFKLGNAVSSTDSSQAKRYYLKSLEVAPRYLEALTRFHQLVEPNSQDVQTSSQDVVP